MRTRPADSRAASPRFPLRDRQELYRRWDSAGLSGIPPQTCPALARLRDRQGEAGGDAFVMFMAPKCIASAPSCHHPPPPSGPWCGAGPVRPRPPCRGPKRLLPCISPDCRHPAKRLFARHVDIIVLPLVCTTAAPGARRVEGAAGAQVIATQQRTIANALEQIDLPGFECDQATKDVKHVHQFRGVLGEPAVGLNVFER